MFANITQPGGAKQRIAKGVNQHIAIRMSHQAFLMGNIDAADDNGVAFPKSMNVIAVTNSHCNSTTVLLNTIVGAGGAYWLRSKSCRESRLQLWESSSKTIITCPLSICCLT